MEFADEIRNRLSSIERETLSTAIEIIDDLLVAEIADRYQRQGETDRLGLFSQEFLPHRHSAFYDSRMLRRLHVCLVVVVGRLQTEWEPPRCRGEELVLRALLDHADSSLEEETGSAAEGFADLRELLFADLDHEYLFDPRFDGIDDPASPEGAKLGVESLHPSAWFVPFYEGASVHPMLD